MKFISEVGYIVMCRMQAPHFESNIIQNQISLEFTFTNFCHEATSGALQCALRHWIWQRLQPRFPGLHRVVMRRDSCRQGCVYYGEGNTAR